MKGIEESVVSSLESSGYHYVNADKIRVAATVDEVEEVNEVLRDALYEESHGFFGTIGGWFSDDEVAAKPLSREEIAKRLEDTDLFEDNEIADREGLVDEIYKTYLSHYNALRKGIAARDKDVGPLSKQFSEVAQANLNDRGLIGQGYGFYYSGYE